VEFLPLGSASPKAMRQYHTVSSETHSLISSEISLKVARTTAYNASGAALNEVLKNLSCTPRSSRQCPSGARRANAPAHNQSDGED